MTNPVAVDFLKSLTYKFGLDPTQKIDMNDPMTRLVMAISIATTEQGENIYSYDQYIKGCAESAGIDPAVFDSEVNPTSLGIENNNNLTGTNSSSATGGGSTSGYVSPKLPKIVAGGSSLPTTIISQYAAAGTAAILATPAFQNYFGGIPLNKITTNEVLSSLGLQNAAASVTNAQGVITAASAGVPASFNFNSSPSAGLTPETQAAINDFSAKWGANPNAITGVLAVESNFNTSIVGGAGGNYVGIFQLGSNQIGGLTKQVFGESLTPTQYAQLGAADQLKVMDQYYANAGIKPGFFTGDATTDTAKAWALQLAPGNAKNLDYSNPNTVISRTNQAGIISAQPGVVTVGSATGSLARGTTIPAATPVSNPGELGLPSGEAYTKTGLTPATASDEAYTTFKDSKGNEYYRYSDGSVYDANEKLVTPPTGVPASYNQQTLNSDGSYTYTDPNTSKSFTQSADLKTITNTQTGETLTPATAPATVANQLAADQTYFNNLGGGNAGETVIVNNNTYTVGSDGQTLIASNPYGTLTTPASYSSTVNLGYTGEGAAMSPNNLQNATSTGSFGIGGINTSSVGSNGGGAVTPNGGLPAGAIESTPLPVPGTGMTTEQASIANQVNQLNDLYANNLQTIADNRANISDLSSQNLQLNQQLFSTTDPLAREQLQRQIDFNSASIEASGAAITHAENVNSEVQTHIENGTEAYAEAGATTVIDPAPTPVNVGTVAEATPLAPDQGVVNSSNITPGSQAQTNAANAAAGGMGAPGC